MVAETVQRAVARALLTDREREILSGEADVSDNYRYKVQSAVRVRIRESIEADAEAIKKGLPESYKLLEEVICDE